MQSSNLKTFFKDVADLHYVVQRNWDNLPDTLEFDGHEDLDVLVSDAEVDDFLSILDSYPEIKAVTDVRTPKDGYYPFKLAMKMLKNREQVRGFWAPDAEAHFLSLYYHGEVHKEENKYTEKLRDVLFTAYPPTKCVDPGVGYYVTDRD